MVDTTPPPQSSSGWVWWLVTTITFVLMAVAFGAGAAKLSYQRSHSAPYAVLAFLLSPLYYPFYAYSQSAASSYTSPYSMMGAARKLKSML